jgi:hypothetical protein
MKFNEMAIRTSVRTCVKIMVPGKDVPFDTFDFTTAVYSEYPEYPEYPEYSEYPGNTAVCYYL